ncbi:hypothetical protein [Mesorhizobium erdmanii]|uniref:hypothetical protein n=1 Tax=Mesorhizobium erdmanii TaxID=1777866 RepID=UPI0012DB6980|nr:MULTISPECIES: hypothetical protein [Mesorhizobium]
MRAIARRRAYGARDQIGCHPMAAAALFCEFRGEIDGHDDLLTVEVIFNVD